MATLKTTPSCLAGEGGVAAIFSVHPDIMKTNVLARLDGPDLVSVTCASSELHALSDDDRVWRDICAATWPSTRDPRVGHVVSSFPSGYRSFFSDSFPELPDRWVRAAEELQERNQFPRDSGELVSFPELPGRRMSAGDPAAWELVSPVERNQLPIGQVSGELVSFPKLTSCRVSASVKNPAACELVSAVDVFYRGEPIISRVHVSETHTSWFATSPFRVDPVGRPGPAVPTQIRHGGESDAWLDDLARNLTLSWILIDPTRNRAANVVSGLHRPVSVTRHWMTRHVEVRYGTVLSPAVNCGVVVTCGGKEGGEVHVTEMSMHVEDLEGKVLNGRDSLVILRGAIEGKRRKRREGQKGKIAYEEFEEMKVRKRKAMQRMEKTLDLVCIVTAVACLMTFLSFVFFG